MFSKSNKMKYIIISVCPHRAYSLSDGGGWSKMKVRFSGFATGMVRHRMIHHSFGLFATALKGSPQHS